VAVVWPVLVAGLSAVAAVSVAAVSGDGETRRATKSWILFITPLLVNRFEFLRS
jgi:hypothetical protein